MSKILIVSALLWALVILAAAYFFGDHEQYSRFFGILIVAAGLQNSLLYSMLKKRK